MPLKEKEEKRTYIDIIFLLTFFIINFQIFEIFKKIFVSLMWLRYIRI